MHGLFCSWEMPVYMPEDGSTASVKPAAVELSALHAGGQQLILDPSPLSLK